MGCTTTISTTFPVSFVVLIRNENRIGKVITASDKTYLEEVLKKGKEKASKKAEENLKKIREIIGFV